MTISNEAVSCRSSFVRLGNTVCILRFVVVWTVYVHVRTCFWETHLEDNKRERRGGNIRQHWNVQRGSITHWGVISQGEYSSWTTDEQTEIHCIWREILTLVHFLVWFVLMHLLINKLLSRNMSVEGISVVWQLKTVLII